MFTRKNCELTSCRFISNRLVRDPNFSSTLIDEYGPQIGIILIGTTCLKERKSILASIAEGGDPVDCVRAEETIAHLDTAENITAGMNINNNGSTS